MTEVLTICIILFLLFGNENLKKIGRIVLAIFVATGIFGLFYGNYLLAAMFGSENFLLLIVLYILFFGTERFKEKSKISISILLGVAVIAIAISAFQNNCNSEEWKNILILCAILLASFIIAYAINSIINRIKRN
ncbi:MAG: hypothetical protein ABFD25_05640 [Clostridiaceae bacterium]